MIHIELSVVIQRPPEIVWAFLMDISTAALWQTGVMNVTASRGMDVGSIITFTSVGLGREFQLSATVTENNGSTRFSAMNNRGAIWFTSTYELESVPEGTRVWLKHILDVHVAFKLAEPVLQSMAESRYEADLANLKILLESDQLSTHSNPVVDRV
jgi:hypothetical protein